MEENTILETAKKIIEEYPRCNNQTDPFIVLITTVISQRNRDEMTEKASESLFSKYKDAFSISLAKLEDLYEILKSTGLFRQKAKRIIEISKIITEEYGGIVPNDLDKLLKLPGVGRKTANIVLWISFGIPALAVDVHVHRISNRLGWIETKHPEESEKKLKEILPENIWGPINGSMVEFGKKICKSQKPLCGNCGFSSICPFGLSEK